MPPKLEIRGFRVERAGFLRDLPDLSMEPGEIVCLSGPSGCGKTTILEGIAGFLPTTGELRVEGVDVTRLPTEKRRIALMAQGPSLFPHLSLLDNVAFALRVRGVKRVEREAAARAWLQRLGLNDLAARRPERISAGQAQRVALARTLAAEFPVVLLDEPFSALDAQARAVAREVLRSEMARTASAAVVVTHDPEDARALAARVVQLSDSDS